MLGLCQCGQHRQATNERPESDDHNSSSLEFVVDTVIINNENGENVVVYEPPQLSQEKMFDAILDKYKGKVVVVDFWATWCGPCMQAMKAIKPLKEEMKEKEVVWVYLTGETSPLKTWTKTYPGISGEHYRVSEKQWDYFGKIYKIRAIPTYILYDRQGKQLSKYTGFPGIDVMKKDIEKGL
jgi:thiol-disulfide isomerase/thioredoxin